MTYHLGTRSQQRLEGVHPHLVECVTRAIERSVVDFSVICGVRTVDEQIALYAQGRETAEMRAKGIVDIPGKPNMRKVTWTLNSNHFVRSSGFGHAVDLAPFVNGKIDWDDWRNFKAIADAMLSVASEMKIPLTWGGSWTKPDGPHFELPKDYRG